MKRPEMEAARTFSCRTRCRYGTGQLKGRHATDAPAHPERPRGRNRSRAGESVRVPMCRRQPASRYCTGAGRAGAQADAVGAAAFSALDGRREEIPAPLALPLHHAERRLPWLGVDRTCLRLRFIRRWLSGHAPSLGRVQSSVTIDGRRLLAAHGVREMLFRTPVSAPSKGHCFAASPFVTCCKLHRRRDCQRTAFPAHCGALFACLQARRWHCASRRDREH
jgi:hypothetical protein